MNKLLTNFQKAALLVIFVIQLFLMNRFLSNGAESRLPFIDVDRTAGPTATPSMWPTSSTPTVLPTAAPTAPTYGQKRALVTLTAGTMHLELAITTVSGFGSESFDFLIFHWDNREQHEAEWMNHPVVGAAIQHIWDEHSSKLGFASVYLTPEFVAPYPYVFLWDGDGYLPDDFDAVRYVDVMQEAGAFLSQPAMTLSSTSTYRHNHHDPS